MAITNEKIEEAKAKLGDYARDIMIEKIPIYDWDGEACKSIFRDEKTPSMRWHKEKYRFKDFSSGQTLDYIDFAMKFEKLTFAEAVKELFDLVGFDYNENDFKLSVNKDFFGKNYKFPKDETCEDRKLVEEYLGSRGISPNTLDIFHVKQSENGRIAYQFYDTDGTHVATKYRISKEYDKEVDGHKWTWQTGSGSPALLYGVDHIDTSKPIIICEGMNDALSCVEAGYLNAVTIPGGAEDINWIRFNYDFLSKFKEVILWFDDDKAGKSGIEKAVNALGIARCKIINSNEDIKNEILEKSKEKVSKIDANNVLVYCGKDAVLRLINGADYLPNPRLKPLFGYSEIELYDLPLISTGFKNVDKIIYGNFQNNLIVVTGLSAGGKSTVVSTMGIIAPLEAGKKVMVFSGEANGGTLLGNIFRPLAGMNHIVLEANKRVDMPNFYRVTPQARAAIRDYYMPLVYNYEDGEDIKTSGKEILYQMDYAYHRYGVTFFTLDNLMCIETVGEDGDNKYGSQIEFAIALKKFTREHDVTVILVAHPKKMVPGQANLDMYSVSGASEIINLSDRVYGVGRLDPIKNEGFNSYISILKDRQSGKVGCMTKMNYDFATSRIYSDEFELKKTYGWENNSIVNYPRDIQYKLLCNLKPKDPTDEVLGR